MGFFTSIASAFGTDTEMQNAMQGIRVLDVGMIYTEGQKDNAADRINRYQTLRAAYEGRQHAPAMDDGDMELTVNYNRPIINKSVDWLFGYPFSIEVPSGNEALSDAIMEEFADDDLPSTLWKFGHSGAIAGDAFLYVSADSFESLGGKTSLSYILPQYVFPVFHPVQNNKMLGCMIQYPISVSAAMGQSLGYVPGEALYSLYITKENYYEYMNRSMTRSGPNPFGEIPVFHAPNLPNSWRWAGDSDLADIHLLTRLRDDSLNTYKGILDYHAEPTTVIIGGTSANLRRGGGRIWSIKNEKARIETLQMDANLPIATYAADLKKSLMELSQTPEGSLGAEQAISNTSAAAMRVKYMSLIEKTMRKRMVYGSAVRKALKLVASLLLAKDPSLLSKVRKPSKFFDIGLKFGNPVPQDIEEQTRVEAEKLRLKIQSRHQAVKNLMPAGTDLAELMLEIMADDRESLMNDVERSRAIAGGVANLTTPFLGSLGLYADQTPLMKKMAAMSYEVQEKLVAMQPVAETETPENEPKPEITSEDADETMSEM